MTLYASFGRPTRSRVSRSCRDRGGSGSGPAGALLSHALVAAALGCYFSTTCGGAAQAQPSAEYVEKLMTDAAWNQVQSMEHRARRYEYVHTDAEPQSKRTTLEIETAEGTVSRLIELNGRPPSEAGCRRDLAQLARLASNPRLQRSQLKEQQAELARREQLFRALPQAFLFRYEGTDKDTGWMRLRYRPNPSFRPRSRVGGVLTGLAGTMWVDVSSRRIVTIEGHVINAVTFGWGILARIYPGGRYFTEQQCLPGGDWRLKTLQVNLRGTIMLVKRLNVNMKETYRSYGEVPSGLTLVAAVDRLERTPVNCGK